MYPIKAFPHPLGTEAAGEIVALPTDEAVLADEEYKLRGLAVGGNVAVVRVSRNWMFYSAITPLADLSPSSTTWAPLRST